ncbi:hypothetical protein [Sphingomonas sp. Y38-1Y]|jgi:hypothetical protein|uniref:hypothetical protein n=1 Tax=Sphingomonas sp. Y38-1Y TaxID=3078265 RepID=UPI0028E8DEA8|nr:hypothetical protein [Sphingomonas sp. Y38-1Y]
MRGAAFWRTFAMPSAIGLLGCIGLVSALTGDGWRDALSWAALGTPTAVLGWAWGHKRK